MTIFLTKLLRQHISTSRNILPLSTLGFRIYRKITSHFSTNNSKVHFFWSFVWVIENEFTRTRARLTFGKKLCPLFLHIFQLMLGQNFYIPWVRKTLVHRFYALVAHGMSYRDLCCLYLYISVLGGNICRHLFFIT